MVHLNRIIKYLKEEIELFNRLVKKHNLEKEITVNFYILLLGVCVVIICNTLDKIGYSSGFYYFFLILILTIFYCVVLHKHKVLT